MLKEILGAAATSMVLSTASTAQTSPLFKPLPGNEQQDRATQAYCDEINAQIGNDAFHVSRFTKDGATIRPLFGPLKNMTIEFDRNAGTATVNGRVLGAEEAKKQDYIGVDATVDGVPVHYSASFRGRANLPLPVIKDVPNENLLQSVDSGNTTLMVEYGDAFIYFSKTKDVGNEKHFYHCVQHFMPPV